MEIKSSYLIKKIIKIPRLFRFWLQDLHKNALEKLLIPVLKEDSGSKSFESNFFTLRNDNETIFFIIFKLVKRVI